MIEDGREHYEKFFLEIEKASKDLEVTGKELSKREKQLQQRETQFEDERKKFNKRKRMDEKEAIDRKKFELEKKNKAKALLELEMDSLRFDIEEMERNGNSEQKVVDGEYGISDNPKNKRGEVHNPVNGDLNEMNLLATPSELSATLLSGWGGGYKTPDTASDIFSRWDGVDTAPGTLPPGIGGSGGSTNSVADRSKKSSDYIKRISALFNLMF